MDTDGKAAGTVQVALEPRAGAGVKPTCFP